MPFDIDLVIFFGFLIINLFVGLRYGKGVKTIQDYALGGRNFSTTALVATIVATWISGSMFFSDLSNVYSEGLYYFIPSLGFPIAFFISAFVFVPRMRDFLGKTSIAEAMGDIYGKQIRVIVAISGAIGSAGSIAVQFKVFGSIFSYFLDMSGYISIVCAGCVVTFYSALGGIRSVTFTDVLQFFTFGCILPLLGMLIWNQAYYDSTFSFASAFESKIFSLSELWSLDSADLLGMVSLFFYFSIPHMKPVWFQRVSMGSNLLQVKKAFIISGFLVLFITLSIAWVPFLLHVINPNLEQSELLGYIIDNYAGFGFKGLLMVAITAMALSTADSYMNASAVLFANDFCKPLNILKSNNELFLSKLFSIGIGIVAMALTFTSKSLLKIILFANSFYIPVVTVPIMLTILGFRTTPLSVLIGMMSGLITSILWKILNIQVDGIIIAMIVNLLFLMGSHYLLRQSGGWTGEQIKKENNTESYKPNTFLSIKEFSFIEFCKKTAPKNELMYTGLGIYCIFFTFSTMYSTQIELLKENSKIILTIYQIMMCVGTIMAMYPLWPQRIKKEIIVQIAWNIVIFFMLVFLSCFFVILSDFGQLQFTIFTMNMMITAILVGWKLSAGMMIIGFYLSVQCYKLYAGVTDVDIGFGSPLFILMYSLMLIGSAIIIFLKPKQEYLEETEKRVTYLESELDTAHGQFNDVQGSMQLLQKQFENKEGTLKEKEKFLLDQLKIRSEEVSKLSDVKDEFIRNLTHESNTPMTSILSLSDILYTYYDKLDKAEIKQSIKDIVKGGERLQSYINSITDLSKLSSLGYQLKREEVNLSQLVKERPFLYKKLFSDECEQQSFVFDVQPDISVSCDRYYITQVLDNLISNAVKYGRGNPIRISLRQNEQGKVSFEIRDEGIGIPTGELVSIFDKFTVSSKTTSPAEGRGVGLALVNKIITMHGGRIWAESDGKSWSVFRFAL